MNRKRIIVGVIGFVVYLFFFWLGGINLLQRSPEVSMTYFSALLCGIWASSAPFIKSSN